MFYGVRVAWQLGEECVEWAVAAVHRCFLYDTLGFMTKERFEAVLTPLVNLIEDSYVSFLSPFPPLCRFPLSAIDSCDARVLLSSCVACC